MRRKERVLAGAEWVVMLWEALSRHPLGWTIVLALFYPLSWILIGAWVLRGLPHTEPSRPLLDGA